jgi:uncharacterized membrane protein YfcA
MGDGKSGVLKSYAPPLVLLSILVVLAAIVFAVAPAQGGAGIPAVTVIDGVLLVIIGIAAGVLGGLIGTGGCSVMLPAIHFWMSYPAATAVGTTLFAVIFTAISGGYGHFVRRNIDVRAVLWLGGWGILGVLLGSYLFTLLSGQATLLGLILGLAFLWPAVRMTWEGFRKSSLPQREGNAIPERKSGWAGFGFFIGLLTGVVGLGGGYALVPGLIYLFGAPVYITMGTSLATMIPLAMVGGGIKLAQGYVAIGAGLLLASGTVVGAQVGAAMIKRFKARTLKLIFGLYFLYVAVKFITNYFGIAIW